LALSTDLSLAHVPFELGGLTREEIGWRATAAALSDLAAVAAIPMGVLVSLGVSEQWPEEQVADVMEGAGRAAAAFGALVWGGDLTRNPQAVINVTVVGRLDGPPMLRSGARVGDELWVTGKLGGPGAALESWKQRVAPDESARERFALPVPRVNEARWLRDHGATAMIDLSDGLAADASHIAAASRVRCAIREELVPVHPSAASEEQALVSGEEYELLCVLPPGSAHLAPAFGESFTIPLTRVGTVEAGDGVVVTRAGQPIEILKVFRHF
jgi:thiamine-monophosphate kinase